ncbi:hypothetical protein TM7x_00960 [Candidatus Nanosynbacter lyticus]|uniref:DUF2207 domain-containing protein n=1 Tax=Candidatus Nanosynbacter lyticus TaxID=2093824 RepID=A0A6S4GRX1_9BACT|nr:DUF2207 domain-containing protein [Candidatus Nanosynbacter lyticus]AJA06743.1 hypothetical protein TM7x_00960 [Candidatus Nanosynbacter lyticus]QCT41348.1 DUF2207 domain-containing protein [TM7 phylum sp. oral taxon 952]
MKRFILGILIAGSLLVGSGQAAFAAQADNFTITKFDAEYSLGRDSENRSALAATWRITAHFPPNQNRGIVPIFVKKYDNHPTNFSLQSVTDGQGVSLDHTWNGDELRIGKKDVYVQGEKTYVIKFTQRDVTKHYDNTGRDEFYWDVIGNEWRVPMQNVRVSVKFDESLQAARAGEAFCYTGAHGSTKRCNISGDKGEIVTNVSRLNRREGITMAVGFTSGTFTGYQETLSEKLLKIWAMVQTIASSLAVILMLLLGWRYKRLFGRHNELKPIPPEYLPPKQASVMISTYILKRYDLFIVKGSAKVAQLLDLAVRHYIKLYEVKKASFLRSAQYEIEIVKDLTELRPEESEVIRDMFGESMPKPGQRLNLKKLQNNLSYAARTGDDDNNLKSLARGKYALCEQKPENKRIVQKWALWVFVISVLLLSPMLLIVAGIVFALSFGWSLTDEGLVLRRYLAGLKMYIGVAEAERLQMLQSPEGAEKVKINTADERQLVKLYERILPYAVLFGQEKEWSKQLGKYYEQVGEQPDWYSGQGAFNAAAFAAGMNSLSSVASSASDYSSTSGGSTGGGFAGGGGGGGGGGGW